MDRLQDDMRREDGEVRIDAAGEPGRIALPDLRMEEYFLGRLRGHCIFQDRFGKLRQEFAVDMNGRWDGRDFLLDERFRYRDGTTSRRLWRVGILPDGRYEATADDIVGVAVGQASGTTIRWRYTLAVPVGGRLVNMRFDDRLFLQEDGVVINVSDARKWGIRLGRLAGAFRAAD